MAKVDYRVEAVSRMTRRNTTTISWTLKKVTRCYRLTPATQERFRSGEINPDHDPGRLVLREEVSFYGGRYGFAKNIWIRRG